MIMIVKARKEKHINVFSFALFDIFASSGQKPMLTWNLVSCHENQTKSAKGVLYGSKAYFVENHETREEIIMDYSAVNTIWVLVGAALVFFMQAGFAMVETGFTRAKNAGNIIMKNLMDFCIGTPAFWLVGFGIMFGAGKQIMAVQCFLTEFRSGHS